MHVQYVAVFWFFDNFYILSFRISIPYLTLPVWMPLEVCLPKDSIFTVPKYFIQISYNYPSYCIQYFLKILIVT